MKRAKVIEEADLSKVISWIEANSRHPLRDKLAVFFTVKAGLRAIEAAGLTWDHITKSDGTISDYIDLPPDIVKGKKKARIVPMHKEIKTLLEELAKCGQAKGPVLKFASRRKNPAHSLVVWFGRLYDKIGLTGCTSHSGRRTFITKTARKMNDFECSLRDIQLLVGHSRLETTQSYIEPQRKLTKLVESI